MSLIYFVNWIHECMHPFVFSSIMKNEIYWIENQILCFQVKVLQNVYIQKLLVSVLLPSRGDTARRADTVTGNIGTGY